MAQALGPVGNWFGIAPGVALSFQWITLIALIVDLAVAIPLSYLTYRGRRPAISDLEA
jgi:hypothetical protein